MFTGSNQTLIKQISLTKQTMKQETIANKI